MSEERGRKLLMDLAKVVSEKVAPTGEPILNREGLKMVERIARDLTAPGGMPGLKLWRDAPSKFRLQRAPRNAEITLHWQRDIGDHERKAARCRWPFASNHKPHNEKKYPPSASVENEPAPVGPAGWPGDAAVREHDLNRESRKGCLCRSWRLQ